MMAGVAVGVLALTGWHGVAGIAPQEPSRSAQATLDGYLSALGSNDAMRALEFVTLPVGEDSDAFRGALTDEVMAAANIQVPVCDDVEVLNATQASADCGLGYGGVETVQLALLDGGWKVVTGTIAEVRQDSGAYALAELSGVALPTDVVSGERTMLLFAGLYSGMSQYFPAVESAVRLAMVVVPGQPVSGGIVDEPRDPVVERAEAEAIAAMERCAETADESCPTMEPGTEQTTWQSAITFVPQCSAVEPDAFVMCLELRRFEGQFSTETHIVAVVIPSEASEGSGFEVYMGDEFDESE